MPNLVISNFRTGFENDVDPFLPNNDAFPLLKNFFCWRGKIKRKRGTKLLGRLRRDLTNKILGDTDVSGNFSANILSVLSLNPFSNIVPTTIQITVGAQVFTEFTPINGTLTNGGLGTGSINYNTGDLTLNTDPDLPATPVSISFGYSPTLPVMGLEEFNTEILDFSRLVAFDTKYSYEYDQTAKHFYDVSFYKNTHNPVSYTHLRAHET